MFRRSASPSAPDEGLAWHAMTAADACARLALRDVSCGLDASEVAVRARRHGPNDVPVTRPTSSWRVIRHQVASPLVVVLLVAAAVSLAVGDRLDAGFILVVVLVNTLLGAVQEWRAERSAAGLQALVPAQARVVRDGVEHLVPARELVPGDVVHLESGQRVPADLRLLACTALRVDESLLTGESNAVDKSASPVATEAPMGERTSVAHAGTSVVHGRATGIVVAIGRETALGHIAGAVATTPPMAPPLVQRLERFARQVSVAVLVACGVVGLIALGRGWPASEVFFTAVALAVSAIPEALPVAVTVALARAARRMAGRRVIVRRLAAVEGLGSCTCIAADKTGTLTVNRQAVRRIVLADGTAFTVEGEGDTGAVRAADGARATPDTSPALAALARAVVRCNEAQPTRTAEGWRYEGDAVDVALLDFATRLGLAGEAVRAEGPLRHALPFESQRAFAATFHTIGDRILVSVKGAPEAVLPRCGSPRSAPPPAAGDANGTTPPPTGIASRLVPPLTDDGYKVLAVAVGECAADAPLDTLPPLECLGVVALQDPLRPEAPAAVARARGAGIAVAMVTGDHPRTARAIARDLGLEVGDEAIVTGPELARAEASGPAAVDAIAARGRVFARVAPLQKLALVRAWQRAGAFVAVTGDGANDAPALRAADVGVAMGSGADVAKDTASLIVTDDRFASITAGVEEGRIAYDNIRKVTLQVVSTGAAEVLLLLLAVASGLPVPLTAVQLLWLNLVTNGIQDVALAFEAGEPDVMAGPPRSPREGLLDSAMVRQVVLGALVIATLAFGAWTALLASGRSIDDARTSVLLLFVLMQNVHAFNCRSERRSALRVPLRDNPVLVAGVVAAQSLHLLALHLPLTQRILDVRPVTRADWLLAVGSALLLLVVMEANKLLGRRRAHRRATRETASP